MLRPKNLYSELCFILVKTVGQGIKAKMSKEENTYSLRSHVSCSAYRK